MFHSKCVCLSVFAAFSLPLSSCKSSSTMRRRNDNSISSICSSSMHPPQQGDCFFPFVVVSLFLRACLCVCVWPSLLLVFISFFLSFVSLSLCCMGRMPASPRVVHYKAFGVSLCKYTHACAFVGSWRSWAVYASEFRCTDSRIFARITFSRFLLSVYGGDIRNVTLYAFLRWLF